MRTTFALGFAIVTLAGCSSPKTEPEKPSILGAEAPKSVTLPAPKFVDVTDKSGIRFVQDNYKTTQKHMVETMGHGGGFIDYDNDGKLDILLVSGAPLPESGKPASPSIALYHNLGNGTFKDESTEMGLASQSFYAMGVSVADYDNDGFEDFYVTGVLGRCRLFHNEGGTGFIEVAEQAGTANKGRWGTSSAWVDYDNDGKLDLFVCNYVKYASLADDQPCYAGENKRIYCIPAAFERVACTLYHNEGNGKFRDVSKESGMEEHPGKALGIAVWDYDADGKPDLFVACDTAPGLLFHNLGGGKFEEVGSESGISLDSEGAPHSGMGIDVDEPMNDGKLRMLLTNYQGQETCFYLPTMPGVFVDARAEAKIGSETATVLGFGTLFADVDNDGWRDIVQVNGHVQDDIADREKQTSYAQPTLLFHNQRDGKFIETGRSGGAPFTTKIVGRGVARGDFDNDGQEDLLITVNSGRPMLWRNDSATKSHWLKIKTVGTKSNRSGIGAQISVKVGGKTLRSSVRSGSSYLTASDLRVHFGLGEATSADVEVKFPSGAVIKKSGVKADQILVVTEGK